jgi:hypothetical protein
VAAVDDVWMAVMFMVSTILCTVIRDTYRTVKTALVLYISDIFGSDVCNSITSDYEMYLIITNDYDLRNKNDDEYL